MDNQHECKCAAPQPQGGTLQRDWMMRWREFCMTCGGWTFTYAAPSMRLWEMYRAKEAARNTP